MKYITFLLLFLFSFQVVKAQLPVKWEELSSPEFKQAVEKSQKTCIIPLGIIEKHGPSLPLGTDLIVARDVAIKAAQKEYVVIFPEFFVGQINEARHQPGTVAYSPELVWQLLKETCNEIERNGFEKIILINGHGGNNSMLSYFSMALLHEKHNFALYITNAWDLYADTLQKKEVETIMKKIPSESIGHAGADEAAEIKVIRPDLFKPEKAHSESGKNLARLSHLNMTTSGIDWYACFPNHYAGDASAATEELGKAMLNATVNGLIKTFQQVKADKEVLNLQNRFYKDAEDPLNTEKTAEGK
ncbi:MAG: creatininase family protein [Bacteroidota bacterium]|nr:creatininase family protein [Bacteroidota bacterium]